LDAPSDLDVWGFEKASYAFGDLFELIDRGGPLVGDSEEEEVVPRKRKGKEKARDGDREKRRKSSGRSSRQS
jgi:hypothetical protein